MAAVNFPNSPVDGDTFTYEGKTFTWDNTNSIWVRNPASGAIAPSIYQVYINAVDLPTSSVVTGKMAFVSSTNKLYIWSGAGWYNIALINTNPTITSGPNASYTFSQDGTPTVITLSATDPEGLPITWSYAVTTGSLGTTATVAQADNEFTVTPSSAEGDAGSFGITFTASDGVNLATAASSFTLAFGPDWTGTTLVQTLDNPNAYGTSANDQFGAKVSMSGDYAIVSAQFEIDAGGANSGKAYIYDVATGALLFTLDNPNPYGTSANDQFGFSVGISGDYAIIGAPYEDDAGGGNSGKAYIFNVTTGALLFTLDNPNAYSTSANDLFGEAVAISGNYAIVGAPSEDDAGGLQSGKAYIFNVTTGALVHTLNNTNWTGTSAGDYFGSPVAISGNYAIVGAYGEDDAGGLNSGKAYIFNVTTGALFQVLNNPNAYDTSAADSWSYNSISMDGNYAVISTVYEDDVDGADSGKAYIFNVTTGALLFTLDNPNPYGTSAGDSFGFTTAISGDYAIIGAVYEDGPVNSGKAYIYNVTTGALLHTLDDPNAYGTSDQDNFGYSVGISGNYIIVGAKLEDDASGNDAGKAYIFQAG